MLENDEATTNTALSFAYAKFNVLKSLVQREIEDIANNPELFHQPGPDFKEFIDKRISLAKKFNLQFWKVVDLHCAYTQFAKLQAFYKGKSLKEFYDSFDRLSESKDLRRWIKNLMENKNDDEAENTTKEINLTGNEFSIVKGLIQMDIEDLGNEPGYFEDPDEVDAKEYIDERIAVAKQFDLNFWQLVDLKCGYHQYEKLMAYYNRKPSKNF